MHGEQPHDVACLIKFIGKTIRLKLLSVKGKGHKHLQGDLIAWFAAQEE